MTPTMLKNLSNTHLKLVWQNAAIDLREASRIVFLGYSCPLADFECPYLLLKAVSQHKDFAGSADYRDVKIRVLLYPEHPRNEAEKYKRDEEEKRCRNLFAAKDIQFKYMDIRNFMTNEDLVWNW
jgi:hypothetical protein